MSQPPFNPQEYADEKCAELLERFNWKAIFGRSGMAEQAATDFLRAALLEGMEKAFNDGKADCASRAKRFYEQGQADLRAEIRREIIELAEPYDGAKWLNQVRPETILALPSLTLKDELP